MLDNRKNYLLPAVRPGITKDYLPELPVYNFVQWTVGRGSVIWSVWPAVVIHSLFAAFIVFIWDRFDNPPVIPDIMLTVLGVVIGFVISYRAVSGYERYWNGRSAWMEIIATSRSLGRIIWIHVPARLTPKTEEEIRSGEVKRSRTEIVQAMAEKKMALDLLKGFAYAVKHHMRGELGYLYEDLYDLVKPLHDHGEEFDEVLNPGKTVRRPHRITKDVQLARPASSNSLRRPSYQHENSSRTSFVSAHRVEISVDAETVVDEDTTTPRTSKHLHRSRRPSSPSALSSSPESDERRPLLQPEQPGAGEGHQVLKPSQAGLMPFGSFFWKFFSFFSRKKTEDRPDREHPALKSGRRWAGPIHPKVGKKGTPRSTGSGENLPVEILRCLSEWFAVLEDRNTVPGASLGGALGSITNLERLLSSLECILTTPLPFVYSAHIRQTVWIYLFLLPLQLVTNFGYYTVLATAIATFIYLGFLAAGEEIEQPFGYDENDLDLDLFCREIIGDEIDTFKVSPSLNSYIPASGGTPPSGNQSVGRSAGLPPPMRRSTMSLVASSKLDADDEL
ncbi:Bestrophin, RFP-TM, chloride channel-domain-containing protein [Flagelloscypha sp. PMI_526]|nr:Bestrophin, RFP-TM, chloride channel-domain-containing protein [Flagelloscypha sp. PMI_526]